MKRESSTKKACKIYRILFIANRLHVIIAPLCEQLKIYSEIQIVYYTYALVLILILAISRNRSLHHPQPDGLDSLRKIQPYHNINIYRRGMQATVSLALKLIEWMFWYWFVIIIMLRVAIKTPNSLNSCEREVCACMLQQALDCNCAFSLRFFYTKKNLILYRIHQNWLKNMKKMVKIKVKRNNSKRLKRNEWETNLDENNMIRVLHVN